MAKSKKIQAYKVFDSDWTCKGFKYEVGKTYQFRGAIELCKSGYHACKNLVDCFNYKSFDPTNKVAIVECSGKIEESNNKLVCSKIKIVEELSWEQALQLCNIGKGNSGYSNSGNWNSGDSRSGYFNSNQSKTIKVFNKDCKIKEWEAADKPDFIYFNLNKWVYAKDMTKEEKVNNKDWEILGGYLKTYEYKEAWQKAWDKAEKLDRKKIENLPNFSWKVFTEITGIKKPKE